MHIVQMKIIAMMHMQKMELIYSIYLFSVILIYVMINMILKRKEFIIIHQNN